MRGPWSGVYVYELISFAFCLCGLHKLYLCMYSVHDDVDKQISDMNTHTHTPTLTAQYQWNTHKQPSNEIPKGKYISVLSVGERTFESNTKCMITSVSQPWR
jgi:hypothetical protein